MKGHAYGMKHLNDLTDTIEERCSLEFGGVSAGY
jgi:hypothetical protein